MCFTKPFDPHVYISFLERAVFVVVVVVVVFFVFVWLVACLFFLCVIVSTACLRRIMLIYF